MTEPDDQRTPLDLLPSAVLRRRALVVSAAAVVIGVVIGVVAGVFAGWSVGLVVGVVLCLPLLVLAFAEARRQSWLSGGVVHLRAFGTRSVDVRRAGRIELLVTDVRGSRSVGILVGGPPKGKTVNVAVALYSGDVGRELDIVALRRLADALAGTSDSTDGLVFAELLVAQLRAEARGAPAVERPLYRIAGTAPKGRLTHRISPDVIGRFVASLD